MVFFFNIFILWFKNNVNFALIVSFLITLLLWLSITVAKSDFDTPIKPDDTVRKELANRKDDDEPGEGL